VITQFATQAAVNANVTDALAAQATAVLAAQAAQAEQAAAQAAAMSNVTGTLAAVLGGLSALQTSVGTLAVRMDAVEANTVLLDSLVVSPPMPPNPPPSPPLDPFSSSLRVAVGLYSCTSCSSSGPPCSYAVDGDNSTYWVAPSSSGHSSLTITFTNPVRLAAVAVLLRPAGNQRDTTQDVSLKGADGSILAAAPAPPCGDQWIEGMLTPSLPVHLLMSDSTSPLTTLIVQLGEVCPGSCCVPPTYQGIAELYFFSPPNHRHYT